MTMSNDELKCPVDHTTRLSWLSGMKGMMWSTSKPNLVNLEVPENEPKPVCPVDHNTRKDWIEKISVKQVRSGVPEAIEESSSGCDSKSLGSVPSSWSKVNLPTEREVSSIPRTSSNENWIYPSQKQFFEAMKRKNWDPKAEDMQTVVPIHNSVNESAWKHILYWERANYEEAIKKCNGITLTSFKGDLKKITPRAWFNNKILGYDLPFDRHDWTIDRCGVPVNYVIDFYSNNGSVFLDVRPNLNHWEGIKLRLGQAMGQK